MITSVTERAVEAALSGAVAGARYRFTAKPPAHGSFEATFVEVLADGRVHVKDVNRNSGFNITHLANAPYHFAVEPALIESVVFVPEVAPTPSTWLQIVRLGYPIPFPSTPEELREQLVWFVQRDHERSHGDPREPKPMEECVSPRCRMALALTDPQFRCADQWHLAYQGASSGKPGGDCPTCGRDWLALHHP